jgi:hypothetical protein
MPRRAARTPVLVGNGQGFWGDSVLGPTRLVREGPLHYLTLDYLAEVTMSILQKARSRDPDAGYATDFVRMLERVLPICRERGIRIIANAGGVNPSACATAVARVVHGLGLSGVRIGVVEGDDILDRLGALLAAGEELRNLDTGEPLAAHVARVQSANAYLGAGPIVAALEQDADIVITGRCTDASLTVAPLVYEFGWDLNDHDAIAAATIAGHIIECGTQCTGGNYDGWRTVEDFVNIGYPVVEANPDGSFVVTKHPGTGGRVDIDTITAQILYEIGDPRCYQTADVDADFTSVRLVDDGANRVRVEGARGAPPSDVYKVSCTMADGYKAVGQLTVAGPDASAKARLLADILFARLELDGATFDESARLVELVGSGVCFEGMHGLPADPPEVVLRVGVRDHDRRRVDRFGSEIAALLLSGPPGATGFAGGRPKAAEVLVHWPALVAKQHVPSTVTVEEA